MQQEVEDERNRSLATRDSMDQEEQYSQREARAAPVTVVQLAVHALDAANAVGADVDTAVAVAAARIAEVANERRSVGATEA